MILQEASRGVHQMRCWSRNIGREALVETNRLCAPRKLRTRHHCTNAVLCSSWI